MARFKVEIESPMRTVVELTMPNDIADDDELRTERLLEEIPKLLQRNLPSGVWRGLVKDRAIKCMWRA